MPTNITGTSTFTDPVVAPSAGDPVTGAGVQALAQGLANRDVDLQDQIDDMKDYIPGLSGSFAWPLPLHLMRYAPDTSENHDDSDNFQLIFRPAVSATQMIAIGQVSNNTSNVRDKGIVALNMPAKGRVLYMVINGEGGHTGSVHTLMPAVQPSFRVLNANSVGDVNVLGSLTTTFPNTGVYDAPWSVILALDIIVDPNASYWLELTCESGANSISFGYRITGLSLVLIED